MSGAPDPPGAADAPEPTTLERLAAALRSTLPEMRLPDVRIPFLATTPPDEPAEDAAAAARRRAKERRASRNNDPALPAHFLQGANEGADIEPGEDAEEACEELQTLDRGESWGKREVADQDAARDAELDSQADAPLLDEEPRRTSLEDAGVVHDGARPAADARGTPDGARRRTRDMSAPNARERTPDRGTVPRKPLTPDEHRRLQDTYVVLETSPAPHASMSAHRFRAFPADRPIPAPPVGRLHLFVLELSLPTLVPPPQTPYVRLRMADQNFDTCVSSRPSGLWNEGFEFRVPYHLQLFGTVVLDVYQGNAIAMDQWVGRCEVRLDELEGLPRTYESWFELWGRVSNPGTAHARGEVPLLSFGPPAGLASGLVPLHARLAEARGLGRIGALRLRIVYQWQPLEPPRRAPRGADNPARARSASGSPPRGGASGPLSPADSEPSSPLHGDGRARPPSPHAQTEEDLFFPELLYDESQESPPGSSPDLLGRLTESLVGGRDNLRLVQAIRALLASAGQGIEEYLGSPSLLSGLLLLRRFHASLPPPEPRRERMVRALGVIEELKWSWRFAMAAYGWVGLGFQAGASGASIKTPSANHHAHLLQKNPDAASIVEFLRIPREDLIESEVRSAGVFAPFHYLCVDRMREELVLAIRGSLSARDVLTDLTSFYTRWNGGLAHHGILRSALSFRRTLAPTLPPLMRRLGLSKLRVVGHSLGGGTATLLTMMLLDDRAALWPPAQWPGGVEIRCDAFGTPHAASEEVCRREEYLECIRTVVCGWDFFARASYGSVEDLKSMVVAAVEAAGGDGHLKEVWKWLSSETTLSDEDPKFAALAQIRAALGLGTPGRPRNRKLWPPGTIYFLHKPPAEDRVDAKAGDGVERRQGGGWVMERVGGDELEEIVLRPSMLVDHFPSTYDFAIEQVHYDALRFNGYVPKDDPSAAAVGEEVEMKEIPKRS
ncbi:hypothetical protein DFJ74DRAFT_706895 [Hyaloraphidium curvatum]|nr:hypothetical protein DFJ74DRAFT_706895 [Hyaloraphidium curvatum]